MSVVGELYKKFGRSSAGDLTSNQKKELRSILSSINKEDVSTIKEHEEFVKAVHLFRKANAEDAALFGKHFLETLKSLLAVGEDGVYSNSKRFLYELIQNVDDCEYEHEEDCKLDIRFDFDGAIGKIILTYNEKGFTPRDVFGITGIAENNKNVSSEKIEIGEKGIGFKSVFGIADKVLIESGKFSFELDKNNFTIPIPKYEGYVPVKGTRMTLVMSPENAKNAFRSIMDQYKEREAVLNQNPILFLNKLTYLKIYYDDFRYVEFDVQRKNPLKRNGLNIEEDVVISTDMKDHIDGHDRVYNMELHCSRYAMPIVYGKNECKSRYGDDILFTERRHNIIAVFPRLSEELEKYKNGVLYSFLPTQIKINAPVVMHIPFKLDGSREYVDSQNNNLWFSYTLDKLSIFLKNTYIDLAHSIKQNAIYYIPCKHSYFFNNVNQKADCLCVKELKSDAYLSEKVFCVSDGSFESSNNVMAFPKEMNIQNPIEIYKLLNASKKLFVPTKPTNMEEYNCTVILGVYQDLFKQGILHEENFERIAEILSNLEKEIDYERSLLGLGANINLTEKQMVIISKHKKMSEAFVNQHKQQIFAQKLPAFFLKNSIEKMDDSTIQMLKELVESAELQSSLHRYLASIGYKIFLLGEAKKGFALAGKNGLALSKTEFLSAFSNFVQPFDENKMFSASLQIRQGSERLNAIDDSISNDDYLRILRDVRRSLKDAYGPKTYESYIRIINKAGADKNRFLNELLQNADDCEYDSGVKPEFSLKRSGDIIEVAYNEKGFSKNNVRAITAIGESTKNALLSGETTIGEKGVGFKSVFGVANEVEIHSNGFDFKLNGKTPTIPEKCDCIPIEGTFMRFKMKENISKALTDERILSLCLCLRKLKTVIIEGKKLQIEDNDDKRSISYNGKRYHFDKVEMRFKVEDEEAIIERSDNTKEVTKEQKIICYLPKETRSISPRIYVGLPTEVTCNIPMLIDAPFELTTSRDGVLINKWNNLIREKMYEAILNVMEVKKEELRIDIFQYIKLEKAQNGTISFSLFSDQYFNTCDWFKKLRSREFMPLAFEKRFVALDRKRCVMISDVVYSLGCEKDLAEEADGVIIDTFHKSQYATLLEFLGIKKMNMETELECIDKHADKIASDQEYRKEFYTYLYLSLQVLKNKERVQQIIKRMPVFPIKTKQGTQFVPFSNDIYVSKNRVSNDELYVLDTSVLPLDRIYMYTGEHINELTQMVFDAKYQQNLLQFIQSGEHSEEEIARHVLREFLSNREAFNKCKPTLKGIIDDIPMKMASGKFQKGHKFINKKDLHLSGEILKEMFVDKKYQELAEYLDCEDILDIHFDDIDYETGYITDADIEEIQMYFEYYTEILNGYMEAGIITAEQIEKFNLQYYEGTSSDDDIYEEFPGGAVKNLAYLRRRIREQFKNNPNPYVSKQYTKRVPQYPVNDAVYTTSMYQSTNNENKCFCQMCKKMVPMRYIERNNVQEKPKFAWDQMYLSLCLTCSKDYILARNNKAIWRRFIEAIEEADTSSKDKIEIEMGDKTLTFTSTHLAEIQEIFKVMNEA